MRDATNIKCQEIIKKCSATTHHRALLDMFGQYPISHGTLHLAVNLTPSCTLSRDAKVECMR